MSSREIPCDAGCTEGTFPCYTCGGSGQSMQECGRCHNSGAKTYERCDRCGGDGKITELSGDGTSREIDCDAGCTEGTFPCYTCGGSGQSAQECTRCHGSNSRTYERCDRCGGDGKITEYTPDDVAEGVAAE